MVHLLQKPSALARIVALAEIVISHSNSKK